MHIDQSRFKLTWPNKVMLNSLFVLAYVLCGQLGLLFTTHDTLFSVVWPPSGVSLAIVLLFGIRQVYPGIIIGTAILASFSVQDTLSIVGLISSNLLEALIASTLLNTVYKVRFKLKCPFDIISFILIAVILAPFISSTLGLTFMYSGQLIETESIPRIWLTVLTGNAFGILIFTPLTLSFFVKDDRKRHIVEAILLYLSIMLVSDWAFDGVGNRKFIIIPMIMWAALRFSYSGVSMCTIIIGVVALRSSSAQIDHEWIQCLTVGIAMVGYFLATITEAQEVALEKEIELNNNIKHKKLAEEAFSILDQTIHKSPMCFGLIDKDYRYIRINEAMAILHGISADAHLGKTLKDITPSTSHLIEPLIDKVFSTGEAFINLPFKGISEGLLTCYPIRLPLSKEIFAVVISFQDLSKELKIQNLLRENQERLAFAQDAGRIGAFEWDGETGRIFWTTELEHIYGIDNGEFGGFHDSWTKMIHPEDLNATTDAVLKVFAGETELNQEFRIITKTQETRWILARGKMVRDNAGNNIKFIGINIDMTEQKSTEQKLRVTEANLLHALSVRDEFMATASHELKTPLTSLKLQIQLYQRSISKNHTHIFSPAKVKQLMDNNLRQIDRLTRLVDDMLDISRMRTGKLTLTKEPITLNTILSDILERTQNQFILSGSGKPIILHMDKAEGLWDPLRIEQVMTNIITNSIRYGQGRPITIAVKNYMDTVRFSVKDQGLGIAKSDFGKIFNRYERGLLAREISGLGLGLFISKEIVEGHGGKIWVESEVNQGATFYVDLPRTVHTVSDFPVCDQLIEEENLSQVSPAFLQQNAMPEASFQDS